jgi:hypothetical protein
MEKDSEMFIAELLDYNIVLAFIYRSPDSGHLFLKKFGYINSKSAIKRKKSNFI